MTNITEVISKNSINNLLLLLELIQLTSQIVAKILEKK